MAQGLRVHAGLIAFALWLAAPATAIAQPAADQLFEEGVAFYDAESYREAADKFAQSFEADPRPATLFAWAQSERLAGDCTRAITLYQQLLAMKISTKTKAAVEQSVRECRETLAAPEPAPAADAEPAPPQPPVEPAAEPPRPIADTAPAPRRAPGDDRPAWYKNPIGGALVGTGVVALGAGIGLYASASSASSDADRAADDAEWNRLKDRARSRGRLGVVGLVTGSVLVAAGVTWYVWRPVSVWADDSSAGVTVSGAF